jgi:hypothetical protein
LRRIWGVAHGGDGADKASEKELIIVCCVVLSISQKRRSPLKKKFIEECIKMINQSKQVSNAEIRAANAAGLSNLTAVHNGHRYAFKFTYNR